ncbi:RagB/SusD family nutrient uptake outer membrane protein [Sphingobacterium sp. UT-1RO-CII-1]|uniref:RagB/SusD family nutrient uptake outer membrane protein n=1 Tax=Sphingobacterium sp. UT-1RO-CII-1 TaxID=2995225 RepID=UPI00227D3802|nr:RagB/SusD family nutrient uptake outer membrane protein [Sphingobacterium sp. UT-1RO-CII-1]MCY4778080.1 RagB/SusD family nutrient uptake outer membrane protein [Sphingobacterium sp. UT-1RO-CII-1]
MKRYFLSIMVGMGFLSSCNYLNVDEYFDDTLKFDSIWTRKDYIERYMWGAAALLPDEGQILSGPWTPGPMATDEAICNYTPEEFKGLAYILGQVSEDDQKGLGNWANNYKIIRKCNTVLANLDKANDLLNIDKIEITGYTKFLRAYAYYNLLMDFGPLVLLGDDILDNNEPTEYYNTHRQTYDESVDYICEQMEEAAGLMPDIVAANLFGRPTKGAAYALIARLRLQQASPLYNGGTEGAKRYFSSWTRTVDGQHYVSQQYDEKKYALAAAAALRVIEMNAYQLHTVDKEDDTMPLPTGTGDVNLTSNNFPYGAANIDPFRSYNDMFTGETVPFRNKEFIWARNSGAVKATTRHAFNVDLMGGWNGLSVTQKMVDAYYMVDGRDISNASKDYPYVENQAGSGGDIKFSGYTLRPSKVDGMYQNREMRFYANIGFSGRYWTANTTSEGRYKNQIIEYFLGANSGKTGSSSNSQDYPISGYVLTKYVHADDAWKGTGGVVMDKSYAIIRYAEILLAFAEASNHLTQSHTIELGGQTFNVGRDQQKIKESFNQVRYRAGLPGMKDQEVASVEKVQELIERELMIEFLFENRRYYDVRRWGKYEEIEREPIVGMNIEAPQSGFHQRVAINHRAVRERIVDRKMIWLPVSKNEVRKIKDFDQNPGW